MTHFTILLALSTILIACGIEEYEQKSPKVFIQVVSETTKISPELQAYVDEFEIEFNVAVTLPSIILGETYKSGIDGAAHPDGRVEISGKNWWNKNKAQREQLMFHELAHAVFGLGHHKDSLKHSDGSVFKSRKYLNGCVYIQDNANDCRGNYKTSSAGMPTSIMDPQSFNKSESVYYANNREDYLDQLAFLINLK